MTVDLRGVNTHNKGAHLMMIAVAQRLGSTLTLSTSPNGSTYDVRARLGLRQTIMFNQLPKTSAIIGDRIPRQIGDAFGFTSESQITGVIDASGFAYSDSFSSERSRREAGLFSRLSRRGIPIVMLPQAFGPFERADQRSWSRKLLQHATIVFARDRASLGHITALYPDVKAALAPDFTVGLESPAMAPPITGEFAAIVPNSKMVTHTRRTSEEYLGSMVQAGEAVRAAGLNPLVVVHEDSDLSMSREISRELGSELFTHHDPLVLKHVLGDARIAVASRFHAIVGGLSQGTPVLAHGWSHKYGELMRDFGVLDWQYDGESMIGAAIERVLGDSAGQERLRANGEAIKSKNDQMWEQVLDVLEPARTGTMG